MITQLLCKDCGENIVSSVGLNMMPPSSPPSKAVAGAAAGIAAGFRFRVLRFRVVLLMENDGCYFLLQVLPY